MQDLDTACFVARDIGVTHVIQMAGRCVGNVEIKYLQLRLD